jgi:hypothetical protein
VNVQVTDCKDYTTEVRILVSASHSGRAFDLRCEVREKLVAFLQTAYPQVLPQLRMNMTGLPDAVMQRAISRMPSAAE